jgi:hypothetical protein
MAARIRGNGPKAPWPRRKSAGILEQMHSPHEPQTSPADAKPVDAAFDRRLQGATGYRVDAPEGYLGVVGGVPLAGNPPRPLVLVVHGDETMRFFPLTRVATVLPRARRILLWPRSPRRATRARNGAGAR